VLGAWCLVLGESQVLGAWCLVLGVPSPLWGEGQGEGGLFWVISFRFSENRRSPLIRPPATFSPEGEKDVAETRTALNLRLRNLTKHQALSTKHLRFDLRFDLRFCTKNQELCVTLRGRR
jgi:hypothetical protein